MHVSQNVRMVPLVGDRKADKRAVRRKVQRKRQRELNEERKLKVRYRGY